MDGDRKVELTYDFSVENRLKAVSDKNDLLVAMAYDSDGSCIFQLNYNLHTDDDWKGNSDNGTGNDKDNTGSGKDKDNNQGTKPNPDDNTSTGGTNDNNGSARGNTNNTGGSQNQSGILSPIKGEVSELEQAIH